MEVLRARIDRLQFGGLLAFGTREVNRRGVPCGGGSDATPDALALRLPCRPPRSPITVRIEVGKASRACPLYRAMGARDAILLGRIRSELLSIMLTHVVPILQELP